MSRSRWKGSLILNTILKKKQNKEHFFRNAVISENLLTTLTINSVHCGKKFKKIKVSREMLGYKFGDFAQTRTHTPRTKNNKNLKKK